MVFVWLGQTKPVAGIVLKDGFDAIRPFRGFGDKPRVNLESQLVSIEAQSFFLIGDEDCGVGHLSDHAVLS